MRCSERAVDEKILGNIRGCARDALALLAGVPLATPSERIQSADAFVDRWQQGDRPDGVDPDDVPYLFGSLWGECVVDALGWTWATVVMHEHKDLEAIAVLSPDRSLAIYPIHFVLGCVQDADVDCTMALAFNMLVAGKLNDLEPRGYANLMDIVHRIVPRR